MISGWYFLTSKMFCLLSIIATVLSAPLIGDPKELSTNTQYSTVPEQENPEISDVRQILVILNGFLENEGKSGEVGGESENELQDLVELIGLFKKYQHHLQKGSKTEDKAYVDYLLNFLNLFQDDNVIYEANDASYENIEENDEVLNHMFDYLDVNLAVILKELAAAAEFEIGSLKVGPSIDTNRAGFGIETDNVKDETDSKDSRKRNSADNAKEAPLVDVNLEVKPSPDGDTENLKLMYDKRGGICTLINGYSRTPIYVISVCPLGTLHSSVRQMCEYTRPFSLRLHTENIIDLTTTPVQDHEGFVYKNIYCAQCNGVTSMQAWETKLDCVDMQPLSISDGNSQVTLMEQFDDQLMGCERRLRPAMPKMIHQCSHVEAVTRMNQWYIYHQPRVGDSSKGDSSPFPLSFSILMNFGFDGKTHILFTTSEAQTHSMTCNQNEKYDPVNNKCRPIVCYTGYQLVRGTCQKIENYDVDSTADDLTALPEVEDTLNVTLTIYNITHMDMLTLLVYEDDMVNMLATLFNISKERIQNLTVSLLNTTSQNNRTLSHFIEFQRFTTTTTPKPQTKVGAQTDHNAGKLTKDDNKDGYENPNRTIFDDKRRVDTEIILAQRKQIKGRGGHTRKGNVDQNPVSEIGSSISEYAENESFDYLDTGNFYDKEELSPKHGKAQIEGGNDLSSMKSKQSAGHEEDADIILPFGNKSATPYPDFWTEHIGYSARINFILLPAHRNKTLLEKSVKTVVQSMTDLINSNSFMFTINGTNYKVEGVERAPQPASMELFCPKGLHPFVGEADFELLNIMDPKTGTNVTAVKVDKIGRTYFPGQYDLTFNIDGNTGDLNKTHVSSFAFVCNMPIISDKQCDRIFLTDSEYTLFDNKSIKFSGHIYDMSEYEYTERDNSSIFICTPDWIVTQLAESTTLACGSDLVKLVVAEGYLTFILGIISLLCMLSVLVTYGVFEKLRNLPGVNTMNLTMSLFLGELLFISSGWVKPDQPELCSAFGLVLHYLFLASFFWMNVMSYDVYKTFARKCILRRIRKKTKFMPRYSLYAWGGPLVIVAVCAIIDFGDVIDGVSIGYGGQSIISGDILNPGSRNHENVTVTTTTSQAYSIGCWIQEPVASMAAFGGPMVLILLSNAVMFTRTIVCIRASTRSTKSSVRKTSLNHMAGRDDVMLYIRMSTVMGFTWIFGLASAVVSAFSGPPSRSTCIILHLLGILFILFNCSQGIFIFFAFVFNKRVLGLYRGLIQKLTTRKRERPISTCSSKGTLATTLSQSSLPDIAVISCSPADCSDCPPNNNDETPPKTTLYSVRL